MKFSTWFYNVFYKYVRVSGLQTSALEYWTSHPKAVGINIDLLPLCCYNSLHSSGTAFCGCGDLYPLSYKNSLGTDVQEESLAWCWHPNLSQRCSEGLRLGLCAGPSNSSTPTLINHASIDLTLHAEALSCWNQFGLGLLQHFIWVLWYSSHILLTIQSTTVQSCWLITWQKSNQSYQSKVLTYASGSCYYFCISTTRVNFA